jgi:hypothetical protein
MHWNEQWQAWICTGLEYQEVLRKKYGLPDDWKPEPEPVQKWRRSDFEGDPSPEFIEGMRANGYWEDDD